ncbi:MAG: LacI family DNA-binding transcriptional regulator [Cohaesibacter sp.]|nr:LacI family DNA-binding transcriptional regulator [Cohaesibacter sp.]
MAEKRRPTIIDVARKAGVSKSTVSLVLQNNPSVRQSTRLLVLEAMSDLGYVYNRAAANMRMSNAGLVGLVINDLRNPFFTEFATSLQMTLSEAGYSAVIANTDENPQIQSQVVSSMIEHGVSALIISPAYGDTAESFDALERAGIPTMQLLRSVDKRWDIFPFLAPDYVEGTSLATHHLIKQGAKRIAFVGGLEARAITEERKSGYLKALKDEKLEPFILTGSATRDFGRKAAKKLLQEHPEIDAALCFNDLVALGMLSGFQEHQCAVGKDFLLVGFDDIEDVAQTFPSLSSISCNIAKIGEQTAATIINWLEHGTKPSAETRTSVSLSIRQSSHNSF